MSGPVRTNSPCHINAFEWKKRYAEDASTSASPSKRARYNYYYVLESESSQFSDDGTESVYSIQDRETDLAKDTSDTNTKSELSEFEVEYEVATSSDNGDLFAENSTSGESSVLLAAASAVAAAGVLDTEALSESWVTEGDDDSDESALENKITQDKHMCRVCKLREAPDCLPLCIQCHVAKKMQYPPRPKHRKPRPTVVTTNTLKSCLEGLSQADSAVASTSCSQEHQPFMSWDKVKVPPNLLSNDGRNGGGGSSIESETSPSLCMMCSEHLSNSIFTHATSAHMCCCHGCAVKFWTKSKRCAYCNKKAKNVLRLYQI